MLYIDLNKAAYKLHYKTEFQGLPISIENRKGSKRHWYDPHNKTEGTTTMEFPYGYIRGTLGTDGDHVDVYVGDDKEADKVFVITQMKAPSFKEVDEQKCMLGFSSGKEAKAAYIRHYNNPKFFGKMKTMAMDEFKSKLEKKGKLIKGVNTVTIHDGVYMKSVSFIPVNDEVFSKAFDEDSEDLRKKAVAIGKVAGKAIDLEDMDLNKEKLEKKFSSESQRKYMHAAVTGGASVPKKVVEEFQSKTPKGAKLPEKVKKSEEVEKAITAADIAPIVKRQRMEDTYKAGIAQPQPQVGTNRTWDMMSPPIVPIRHVQPPAEVFKGEMLEPCGSCGHMAKADTDCIHCEVRYNVTESVPHWRR